MGELVSEGTCFSCPFCSSKLKISVPSSLAEAEGKKLANTSNYLFLPPGGQCSVTTTPCMPNLTNIDPGQNIVQIDGKMALGSGCKFQCSQGGLVAVDSPSQKTAKHEVTGLEVLEIAAAVALLFVPGVGEAELGAAAVEGGELAGAAAEGGEAAEAAAETTKEIEYVDLADKERRAHILDGEKKGGKIGNGGHRAGTGIPGKTEFPKNWSDDKIIHEISDVATDPNSTEIPGKWGTVKRRGVRDGVEIEAIVDPDGKKIITGYPVNQPKNP